jgi:hypothetical protein
MVAQKRSGRGGRRRRVLAYEHGGDWICARSDVYLLLGRPSSPLYGGRGLGIRSKSVTGVCGP